MTKPRVFVTRILPERGLQKVLAQTDATVWQEELPPPRAVLLDWARQADGLLTLLTDKIDAARRALKEAGFPITETMLLAVEIPDDRGGLLAVTRALLAAEINIHYAYPLFTRPRGHGVVALHIDSLSSAGKVLEKQGFGLLDDRDLEVMG